MRPYDWDWTIPGGCCLALVLFELLRRRRAGAVVFSERLPEQSADEFNSGG